MYYRYNMKDIILGKVVNINISCIKKEEYANILKVQVDK